MEAKQRAFALKVANFKSEIKQKVPTAYSKLVNDFQEWRENRPEQLREYIKEMNLRKRTKVDPEVLVADRVKGHKEAGECLSKLLEKNPEGRKEIHEALLSQVTKQGKPEKGKMSKNGFMELATFFSGEETKDPKKVSQESMVAVISHGIIFAKPRLCHFCDKVMDPGRPSTYVGLECSMCGYAVCTSCNVAGGDYKDMKRTMKGLTIQCAGCQDWGQGGISTMFRAGPTGSIEAEGFAFAFLKQFYEEGKRLPYKRNWMIKGKGPDDVKIPLI